MSNGAKKKIALGTLLGALTCQTILFIAIGLGLWIWSGRKTDGFLRLDSNDAIGGILLGLAFITLAKLLLRAMPRVAEKLVRMQADTYAFLEKPLPLRGIIWISLCAGAGEEALFRAGLQSWIGDIAGAPVAIVLASAAFAFIHFGKPIITVLLFAIGAIFGVVYHLTGSLLLVAIGHAIYDIFALSYLQRELHRLEVFAEMDDESS